MAGFVAPRQRERAVTTIIRIPQLTDSQFTQFSALVYEKTGIYLKPGKKELLNARLGKRLRACGLSSFKDYYALVMRDASGEELINLINSVSTNFTSFFREQPHFDFLAATVLPGLIKEAAAVPREINIWSAACSSGEEPYTIAMVLEEYLAAHSCPGWSYRVLATDISTKVLDMAQQGVYPEDRLAKVPPSVLKKYFQKGVRNAAGYVKVNNALRQRITFKRFNLMDEFPWRESIDIIFCRNVMIYFNSETQQELVNKFFGSLVSGGYLFIGHSESISRLKHHFSQVAATSYRK